MKKRTLVLYYVYKKVREAVPNVQGCFELGPAVISNGMTMQCYLMYCRKGCSRREMLAACRDNAKLNEWGQISSEGWKVFGLRKVNVERRKDHDNVTVFHAQVLDAHEFANRTDLPFDNLKEEMNRLIEAYRGTALGEKMGIL